MPNFLTLSVSLVFTTSLLKGNSVPTDINASNLTIAENSAIGTVIGEFNATDPDGGGNFSYSLVPTLPEDLNLSLWLDASDASTITHSNGSVSQWADKSGNGNHAVQLISDWIYHYPQASKDGNGLIFYDFNSQLNTKL